MLSKPTAYNPLTSAECRHAVCSALGYRDIHFLFVNPRKGLLTSFADWISNCRLNYKSGSSSSGSGMFAASCISFWYCSRTAWST